MAGFLFAAVAFIIGNYVIVNFLVTAYNEATSGWKGVGEYEQYMWASSSISIQSFPER